MSVLEGGAYDGRGFSAAVDAGLSFQKLHQCERKALVNGRGLFTPPKADTLKHPGSNLLLKCNLEVGHMTLRWRSADELL